MNQAMVASGPREKAGALFPKTRRRWAVFALDQPPQRHRPGRRLVEEAIARHPDAELPRVVLIHEPGEAVRSPLSPEGRGGQKRAPAAGSCISYLHLQEGKDRAVAERALRAVLRINPRNTEAENNLAVLLRSAT